MSQQFEFNELLVTIGANLRKEQWGTMALLHGKILTVHREKMTCAYHLFTYLMNGIWFSYSNTTYLIKLLENPSVNARNLSSKVHAYNKKYGIGSNTTQRNENTHAPTRVPPHNDIQTYLSPISLVQLKKDIRGVDAQYELEVKELMESKKCLEEALVMIALEYQKSAEKREIAKTDLLENCDEEINANRKKYAEATNENIRANQQQLENNRQTRNTGKEDRLKNILTSLNLKYNH